jgi:hypothetical protein
MTSRKSVRIGEPNKRPSDDSIEKPSSTGPEWARQFQLTSMADLDFVLGDQFGLPVGAQNRSPEELKKRVATALISYWSGLKSMNYAYDRYVGPENFKEDRSLGARIGTFLEETIDNAETNLRKLTFREVIRLGDQIADVNLLRLAMTLRAAKLLANRGLLFETMCLSRFALEQLAWCYVCEQQDDESKILKLEATSCIKPLCRVYPTAGRLYGFLSKFAHWDPKWHHLFIKQEGSQWAYIQASSQFKATALCHVLLIADIYLSVIETIYPQIHFKARSLGQVFEAEIQTKSAYAAVR